MIIENKEMGIRFEVDNQQNFDKWYAIRKEQIRADAIKEVECEMYHQAFNIDHEEDGLQKWDNGNWIRYKLFENVIIKLKEQK